jgi:hypothetical protein
VAVLDLIELHRELIAAGHSGDLMIAAHRYPARGPGYQRRGQRRELLQEAGDVRPVEQQVLQLAVGGRQI